MLELSNERVEQILYSETVKEEKLTTILRAIYGRYSCLYERLIADLDEMTDEKIAELRDYHEETLCLIRYYYMDIPMSICDDIKEFDEKFTSKALGPDWKLFLHSTYEEYKRKTWSYDESEEAVWAEYVQESWKTFYNEMDDIFREGFGTGDKTVSNIISGIGGMFSKALKEK